MVSSPISTRSVLVVGLTIVSVCSVNAQAADADQPHPHQGKLAPYDGLPEIALDSDQRDDLEDGKLVIMTMPEAKSGGRGVAVTDINAPPDVVWRYITGFEMYVDWVGPVKRCDVYKRDGDDIYTDTMVSGFLYKFEYFIINTVRPEDSVMSWTLDYSRESDFDDCVGCWFVEPHPSREGWSRVWFSNDLMLKTPLPGFLMKMIKNQGMRDATSWVKRESELEVHGAEEPPRPDITSDFE